MRTYLFLSLVLTACSGSSAKPTTHAPLQTDVMSTTGAPTTVVIGAAGGTLTSDDGVLELVVPAGAVSSDTTFTATPITAPSTMSFGAYRLGPEGTTFASAATLTFHVSSAQLAGTTSAGLGVAYQTSDGRWAAVESPVATDDSVSVTTTHLSDWTYFTGYQVRPGTASVMTGQSLPLRVKYCPLYVPTDDELAPLRVMADCEADDDGEVVPNLSDWSVNGKKGGDDTFGTVKVTSNTTASYTAPKDTPDPALVAVSVKLNNQLLVSNVTIGGAYPTHLSGTFAYTFKSGGDNGDPLISYSAMGTIMFAPIPNDPDRRYSSMGTLAVSDYVQEDQYCRCTAGGFSAPLDAPTATTPNQEALYYNLDNTYHWGFGTMGMMSLSCTQKDTSPCDSRTVSWNGGWGLEESIEDSCTGHTDHTFTDATQLSGTYQKTCRRDSDNGLISNESMSWSFSGSN